jgi:signal transduction histidine kinase
MEGGRDRLGRLTRSPVVGYVLVVAGTAVAAALRWVLGLYVDELPPFITFYPVVVIGAVLGGTGAGVLATLLSSAVVTHLFLAHPRDVYFISAGEAVALALFTAINLAISVLGGRLRTARRKAEQANRAKEYFFAVLSHELRTPLMPISWSAQLLAEDKTLSLTLEQQQHLARIRRNLDREMTLINDLLDINRIAHGKLQLKLQRATVQEIIQHAVDVCCPEIESRQLHVTVDAPAEPCFVEADGPRLEQVFSNLMKNALKFTPADGHVKVHCWQKGGQVITEVADSGVGLEPEALSRIFGAFEQVKGTGAQRSGGPGLGLGLAIAKALVEQHGGSISAASAGAGQGSTFAVRLPVMRS